MSYLKFYTYLFIINISSLLFAADLDRGHFIKIGDYPCSSLIPVQLTIKEPEKEDYVAVINFPYPPTVNLANKHITYLTETTCTTNSEKNHAVLVPNARPCIAITACDGDRSWIAHLHVKNNRDNITHHLKNIFADKSSLIAVTLFSAYIPPADYETKNNVYGGLLSWKDMHEGHSQQEEMKYIADLLVARLKIPVRNITVNLFNPSPLLFFCSHNEGINCILVTSQGKIYSVFPKLSGIVTKKSIMRLKKGNIVQGQNNELHEACWSNKVKGGVDSLYQYNKLLLQEIECINCGNCAECLQK